MSERLALAQAKLLRALVGHGEVPAELDAARVHAAGEALARKRVQWLERTWSVLSEELGSDFARPRDAYLLAYPLPPGGAPEDDGRELARFLEARGLLGERGRLAALAWDLHHSARRWGCVRLSFDGRLVLAARLPWLGVRSVAIPWV